MDKINVKTGSSPTVIAPPTPAELSVTPVPATNA